MFFKNLLASIRTPEGDMLLEYKTKQIDDHTIECWIPSTEGANFEIWFTPLVNLQTDLDLCCMDRLDGIDFGGSTARAAGIGTTYKRRGMIIGRSAMRLFSFGRRMLTDREDIAPSKGKSQEELNSIRLTFTWGRVTKIQPTNISIPKESKIIHEKAAKKGHAGSAGLGDAIKIPDHQPTEAKFESVPWAKPVVFIFRYGPEEWLQARGIIPCGNSTSLKRERDPTPDLIDIDDLESDDDDGVTIVKHLVPVTVAPSNKRRKIKGEPNIKPEPEDVKPRLA
ncbi:hypothetical protein FRC08_011087 [Ceratobasidium sp. 394]|nr:hypothetical protein FRC08_011087 [Ceratobasidium sp. 394]KAG9093739.1 hypothetical protein FS749_013833 [Ceratobasidium sp. UAMH 11750]